MEFWGGVLGPVNELSEWGFAARTILVGILLWIQGKVLPHRSGGQFAGYDFAFFWMMGGITAAPLFEPKLSFLNTITAIFVLYLTHYLVSYLAVKNHTFAKVVLGQSIALVAGGKIRRQNMRKALFPIDLLLSELRVSDAANINDVESAVLETSGHVSVLKKADAQPVTPHDLNVPVLPGSGLPVVIVRDGTMIKEGLHLIGRDESWLSLELAKNGFTSIHDVYIAIVDPNGAFYCSART